MPCHIKKISAKVKSFLQKYSSPQNTSGPNKYERKSRSFEVEVSLEIL